MESAPVIVLEPVRLKEAPLMLVPEIVEPERIRLPVPPVIVVPVAPAI
jgi:hypothetical protein